MGFNTDLNLNILLPVYNEEKRLRAGVEQTVAYLDKKDTLRYQLTIVDNASSDQTENIAKELCRQYPDKVHYLRITEKGVGAAFRAGVTANTSDIVGYMDIDLSTDIRHILEMVDIFKQDATVGMVNASRWSKHSDASGRKWYRNITSIGLVWLLKITFKLKASDAICGFKFFRRQTVESLIAEAGSCTNGWFYLIELLIRAERNNTNIYELPVHWEDDSENSTVHTVALIKEYLHQIVALKRRLR